MSAEDKRPFFRKNTLKGALCSFREEIQTENCIIHNINEVIIELFSRTESMRC